MFAFLLNLLPIPPLDGFQIFEPYLTPEARQQLLSPTAAMLGMAFVFFGIWEIPFMTRAFFSAMTAILEFVGIPSEGVFDCYSMALSLGESTTKRPGVLVRQDDGVSPSWRATWS